MSTPTPTPTATATPSHSPTPSPTPDPSAKAKEKREEAIVKLTNELLKLKKGNDTANVFAVFEAVNDSAKMSGIDKTKFNALIDGLKDVDDKTKSEIKGQFAELSPSLDDAGIRSAALEAVRRVTGLAGQPDKDGKGPGPGKGGVGDPTKGFFDPSKVEDLQKGALADLKKQFDKQLDNLKQDQAARDAKAAKDAADAAKNASLGNLGQGEGKGEGEGQGGGSGGSPSGGEGGGDKGAGDGAGDTGTKTAGADTGAKEKRSSTPKNTDLAGLTGASGSGDEKKKEEKKTSSYTPEEKKTPTETPPAKSTLADNNGTLGAGVDDPSKGFQGQPPGKRDYGAASALSPIGGGAGRGDLIDPTAAAALAGGGGGNYSKGTPSVPSTSSFGGGDDPTRSVGYGGAFGGGGGGGGNFTYVKTGKGDWMESNGSDSGLAFGPMENDDGYGYSERRAGKGNPSDQIVYLGPAPGGGSRGGSDRSVAEGGSGPEPQGVFRTVHGICEGALAMQIGACGRTIAGKTAAASGAGSPAKAGATAVVTAPPVPVRALARQAEPTL